MRSGPENKESSAPKKRSDRLAVFAALTVVLAVLLTCGISYARYRNIKQFTVDMKYTGANEDVFLLKDSKDPGNRLVADANGNYASPGGWTSSGAGSYSLDFLLANGNAANRFCMYDKSVSLSVFVSEGLGNIGNITVTLTADGTVYTASFTAVTSSSPLYASYGAGWIGTFEDAEHDTPDWELRGGVFSYKEMTLSVTGTNDYPAAVTLIASAG